MYVSRDFTKNTANYMRLGSNALSPLFNGAAAISVHAWVNVDTFGTIANDNRILNGVIDGSSTGFMLAMHNGTNPVIRIGARSQAADGFQVGNGTTSISASTWTSVGGVVNIAGDSIQPYFNGSAEGGGAVTFGAATYTAGTPTGTVYDAIGSNGVPDSQAQVDGRVAEVAVWNAALDATDFARLAAGVAARFVKRSNLIAYFPLLGTTSPEPDVIGSLSGTITGTVSQAAHPTVIQSGLVIAHHRSMQGIA